ncbi:hypothetical protein [Jeotgalicoccus psychrophilus]|uniref:hypothetical protein n=1 Tax=Jeotgalicoccus psychrophilus TaxID=157228 RepID=UPI000402C963|nr:hypothetical protein [Jeotgalicoccus psychrophilus]MDO5360965.1 hypothetical protein [Jeotgalicoccus sp.]
MLKNIFLMGSVYISFIIWIITDFFTGIPWYVQYGPIILFGGIAVIVAILEMDDDEDDKEQKETGKGTKLGSLFRLSLILFIWLLIAAMNIFVGKPRTDAFNIYDLSFWVFLVAIPTLNKIHIKIIENREKT